jgi:O-antigen/teichoic acid export membrane protein
MSWLAPLAIAGQGLIALLTLALARTLPLADFEDYAVASAVFILMVTAAPLGAEKLSLRVLPSLLADGDPGRLRGFLGWAVRRTLAGTAIAMTLGLLWALWPDRLPPETRWAVAIASLAVPAGVAAHLGLECLTAAGQARFAAFAFRVAVPGTALATVAALVLAGGASAAAALLAWGAGWAVAALLMARRLAAALPPATRTAPPSTDPAWGPAARPLWLYRIAVAAMAQSAILALDWLGAPPAAVGAYAAATGIAALALVLATATNRAYAADLALLLDRRDFAGIDALTRRRRTRILPPLAALLAIALAFAPQLLALFRPEFAAEGAWPLRLLALAAAVSATFALAPTYLKYRRRHRAIFTTVAVAAALQVALLGALVPAHGATGAAVAYGASVALMYAALAFLGARELRRLRTRPLRT